MTNEMHPIELFVGGILLVSGPIYAVASLLQTIGVADSWLGVASIAFGVAWLLWLRRLERLLR